MALQYPGISYLKGYDGKVSDIFDQWNTGFETGRNDRDESNAPDLLAKLFAAQNGGGMMQPTGGGLTPGGGLDGMVSGSHQAVAAAEDPMLSAYFASTRRAESGGNDSAKNPNSSATGRYQFLDATWNDLAQRHPELGLTPDGRNDPAQQEAAMKAFTMDNARQLTGAGVGVNPGTLYAAHFLGAGGASKVLSADPSTPVASIVGPEVIQANPQLANMTVADFQQWAASKGGNGQGGYAGPTMATPNAGGGQQRGGIDPQMVGELFANRSTRPLVAELLNNQPGQVSPTSDMQNYQFAQDNPGFAEYMNGKGSAAANAPAEVQTYLFYREQAMAAGQTPVSFLEFKTALKEKPQGGMPSPTIAKEIFEADEGAQAGESVLGGLDRAIELNKTAWDGPAADAGTQVGALFGDQNSVDTQNLKNVVISQALDQLKATFGGMPTEGERKILLDIQGSVTQPRAVREEIFQRARKAAERRIKFNKDRAAGLRNGEYFDEGYSPVTASGSSGAPTTEDLVKKYAP